ESPAVEAPAEEKEEAPMDEQPEAKKEESTTLSADKEEPMAGEGARAA
ncbi:hypothetical protein HZA45_00605, partial [Candidatus Peregrinibacteria bacterium]|nr:hypothetical protein [Candidatus Peregrinibacteria bacterium]